MGPNQPVCRLEVRPFHQERESQRTVWMGQRVRDRPVLGLDLTDIWQATQVGAQVKGR
jgi:hypothetical protein